MIDFNKKIQDKFAQMQTTGKLFRVELTGNQIWDLYLKSFPKEQDPIFRDPNSTVHNCNCCNSFIRRYGNVVSVDENYDITTMFNVLGVDPEYFNFVVEASLAIKESKITEVFLETFDELKTLPYESCAKANDQFQLGIAKSVKRYTKEEAEKYGVVKPNEIRTFDHFWVSLNRKFVDFSGKSVEALMGNYRDSKNTFTAAMEAISLDTFKLVKDLSVQGSLMNGEAHLFKIEKMLPLKAEFDTLSTNQKDNWCWVKSYGFELARFKNELIGTLCMELAEGKEINAAVLAFNKRVDPVNYMKAKSPITQRQIEDAKKFIEENGYVESFSRRFATIHDLRVSEILHTNTSSSGIKYVSIFDGVKPTFSGHKRSEFDGIEEVNIEKFMKDVLPGCTSIEAFLTNSQEGNLVTLTTSTSKESKQIFKWNNPFSWTFNGNLAGKSEIKDAVKSQGGKVDGVLRFSITWNEDGKSIVDLDAHATEPNGTEIYYGSYKKNRGLGKTSMTGELDVDMIDPTNLGVENITWDTLSKMKDGKYKFWVRNFNGKSNKGFKAEIEYDGEVFNYEYNSSLGHKQDVVVAEVILKNKEFTIKHILPESEAGSKELWGLETNQFHKVNSLFLSPNHWNGEQVGNKHYMFMLEDCKTPEPIRSFHIENLLPELVQHRKVLEVLGATQMIPPSDEPQLAGLGFNATVRDSLIVKLQGSHKRTIRIMF